MTQTNLFTKQKQTHIESKLVVTTGDKCGGEKAREIGMDVYPLREAGERVSRSVASDSLRPRGLQPTRLLCPWDFPDKRGGVDFHFLPQGFSLTQRSKPGLQHYGQILHHLSHQEFPCYSCTL